MAASVRGRALAAGIAGPGAGGELEGGLRMGKGAVPTGCPGGREVKRRNDPRRAVGGGVPRIRNLRMKEMEESGRIRASLFPISDYKERHHFLHAREEAGSRSAAV